MLPSLSLSLSLLSPAAPKVDLGAHSVGVRPQGATVARHPDAAGNEMLPPLNVSHAFL